MIKKKINEDLRGRNIEFEMLGEKYKALRFYQAKMTLDVILLDDKEKNLLRIFQKLQKKC